jgi:histone deacetylase complex regulatory component SIN3
MYEVDTVHVQGHEFRSQSFAAQARTHRGATHRPSVADLPPGDSSQANASGSASPAPAVAAVAPAAASAATVTATEETSAATAANGVATPPPDETSTAPASGAPSASSSTEVEEASVNGVELTTERRAENFLDLLTRTFAPSEPHRATLLVDELLRFQSGEYDTLDVMEKASVILEGQPKLLDAFNHFLPEGYRVEPLPRKLIGYSACHKVSAALPSPARARRLSEKYMRRLCERYQSQPEKLRQLHTILHSVDPDDTPSLRALHDQLATLLADEADLLRELKEYFPSACYSAGHVLTSLPL